MTDPIDSGEAPSAAVAPLIQCTAPVIVNGSAVWFSAYGFGWGYAAYAMPSEAVCGAPDAADASARQIARAFELRKHRILEVVAAADPPLPGERRTLSGADL
ncbi:hypothetical protein BGLT_05004 [Caballeronia glathei]|jgi:hypothetical protein|uniref:Uncharacterized protein n=1 Tax=Caballeronia glathei TaxID=60547 RepID=A0A069PYC7_9BURK|nr:MULTISPECIES: hypothetical protein [Burkholderiaceae]KDR42411.1 hypothetical protein BG61_10000 [Caballeronia glathei]TCK36238.1 hypothetical protein B0G84_5223 [Paraburkholderia sp. BL8N3]CDY79580.1 hypothetical protein BGLT_05004 [Caballeronia glathei]